MCGFIFARAEWDVSGRRAFLSCPRRAPRRELQYREWRRDGEYRSDRHVVRRSIPALPPADGLVTELKCRLDIESLEHLAAKELHLSEIGFLNIVQLIPSRLRFL